MPTGNAKMVFDVLEETSHFREYYNSIDGSPMELIDYIWTCIPAAMIMTAIYGIELTGEGLLITPALPKGWDEVSIDGLRIRNRIVGVTVRRGADASATMNGKTLPARKDRGCFVNWSDLPQDARFEIALPNTC